MTITAYSPLSSTGAIAGKIAAVVALYDSRKALQTETLDIRMHIDIRALTLGPPKLKSTILIVVKMIKNDD